MTSCARVTAPFFFLFALLSRPTIAHEVSVHQRLSEAAARKAVRLQEFLQAFRLTNAVLAAPDQLRAQIIAQMPADLVSDNTDFLRRITGTPVDIIRMGSIVEDRRPDFCNHFYVPIDLTSGHELNSLEPVTSLYCPPRTNAKDWALNVNHPHTYADGLDALYKGLTLDRPESRTESLRLAFEALGHVIHLVQDQTQPSHTRNDIHACGTLLGWSYVGFHGCSTFEHWGDTHRNTVNTYADLASESLEYISPEYAFALTANWSAPNCFSDETILNSTMLNPGYFPEPEWRLDEDGYIHNVNREMTTNAGMNLRVARFPKYHISATAIPGVSPIVPIATMDDARRFRNDGRLADERVLDDNARWLYPLAVQESIHVLNHAFRAKFDVTGDSIPHPDGSTYDMVIHTVYKADDELGTFAGVQVLWEDSKGIYHQFDHQEQPTVPIPPGAAIDIGVQYSTEWLNTPSDAVHIIVAYKGMVGSEQAVVAGTTEVELRDRPSADAKTRVLAMQTEGERACHVYYEGPMPAYKGFSSEGAWPSPDWACQRVSSMNSGDSTWSDSIVFTDPLETDHYGCICKGYQTCHIPRTIVATIEQSNTRETIFTAHGVAAGGLKYGPADHNCSEGGEELDRFRPYHLCAGYAQVIGTTLLLPNERIRFQTSGDSIGITRVFVTDYDLASAYQAATCYCTIRLSDGEDIALSYKDIIEQVSRMADGCVLSEYKRSWIKQLDFERKEGLIVWQVDSQKTCEAHKALCAGQSASCEFNATVKIDVISGK